MKPGRVLLVVALFLAAGALCFANVPVFQHDAVQEKRYFHEQILPRLVALGVIIGVAVAAFVAVRRVKRRA